MLHMKNTKNPHDDQNEGMADDDPLNLFILSIVWKNEQLSKIINLNGKSYN